MKHLFVLTAMLFCVHSANAQNWTKEIADNFSKEKKVAIKLDLSDVMIMDVPLKDYPEYYSGKYSSNEKYATLILDKFQNRFCTCFYKYLKKEKIEESEAQYTIVFKFLSITEYGGFSGTYYVVTEGNKSEVVSFNQNDGKWNDFETLLMENIEKYWKRASYNPYSANNPYGEKRLYPKTKKQ